MKGLVCLLAIGVTTALSLGGAAAAGAKPPTVPGLPVQIALGDSWAAGVGAVPRSTEGYVPQLHDVLRQRFDCLPGRAERRHGCKHLQLVNLAVGGATTPSLIQGQLPAAVTMLERRNGNRNPRDDVEVVSVHIGGNDVTAPIIAACLAGGLTPSCVQTIQAELAAFRSDLDAALSILSAAAGPRGAIVIGTYDNPIPTCQLAAFPGASQLGALVLEGGGPIAVGVNDVIRFVAATYGLGVAEVFGDLEPNDWVGGTDCLHPDNSGHDEVTDSFAEVLVPAP